MKQFKKLLPFKFSIQAIGTADLMNKFVEASVMTER